MFLQRKALCDLSRQALQRASAVNLTFILEKIPASVLPCIHTGPMSFRRRSSWSFFCLFWAFSCGYKVTSGFWKHLNYISHNTLSQGQKKKNPTQKTEVNKQVLHCTWSYTKLLVKHGKPSGECWNSCPERLWMPLPLRCSRPGWMGPWATWSRKWGGWWPCPEGGLEIHDSWGPFQPRPFCDSVKATSNTLNFRNIFSCIRKSNSMKLRLQELSLHSQNSMWAELLILAFQFSLHYELSKSKLCIPLVQKYAPVNVNYLSLEQQATALLRNIPMCSPNLGEKVRLWASDFFHT